MNFLTHKILQIPKVFLKFDFIKDNFNFWTENAWIFHIPVLRWCREQSTIKSIQISIPLSSVSMKLKINAMDEFVWKIYWIIHYSLKENSP